ncbi:hypothetical protein EI94DRAFT_1695838 [Lactarius quietus]|nr:hypothetical protein EI94DRAFT_1695838 [Lactarius quietus]
MPKPEGSRCSGKPWKPVDNSMNETHPPSESKPKIEAPDHKSSLELVEMSAVEFFSSAFGAHGGKPQLSKGQENRTQNRQKKRKADLEAKGFLSLQEFFKQKAMSTEQQESEVKVDPSKENKECKGKEECEENQANMSGDNSGPAQASIPTFEEEAEEEEEDVDNANMRT